MITTKANFSFSFKDLSFLGENVSLDGVYDFLSTEIANGSW